MARERQKMEDGLRQYHEGLGTLTGHGDASCVAHGHTGTPEVLQNAAVGGCVTRLPAKPEKIGYA